MFARQADGAEALYRVSRNNTISFGGGLNARFDQTTWSEPMTADEAAELHALLESQRWYHVEPKSTREPKGQIYRVRLVSPQGRQSFTLNGEHKDVKPLRELLERISLKRLRADLERLPKPSAQTQPSK
jgi:hypothetical protein